MSNVIFTFVLFKWHLQMKSAALQCIYWEFFSKSQVAPCLNLLNLLLLSEIPFMMQNIPKVGQHFKNSMHPCWVEICEHLQNVTYSSICYKCYISIPLILSKNQAYLWGGKMKLKYNVHSNLILYQWNTCTFIE